MSPSSDSLTARLQPGLSTRRRYLTAAVLVACAVALRALLHQWLGPPSVFLFLSAILLSGWIGGVGPALGALLALHVIHAYWFLEPPGLWQPDWASVASTGAYYLAGITVGLLSEKRRAAIAMARAEHLDAIAQREQLRTALACIADGVLVTNVAGEIELMNRAAEAATGWTLAEAKGRRWQEVFSLGREGSNACLESPVDRALQEQAVVHETSPLILRARHGGEIPIAYSAAPVADADGAVSGVVLSFKDESARRRDELALKEADRRKDEFLATLAHELRNPLAPIAAGIELLKGSTADPGASEEIRLIMERQTQHMVRLIDDLMDVSRITRGKLALRESDVALHDVIRNAVDATKGLFVAAGHRLTLRLPEAPVVLHADGDRLTQVFSNLLSNAAKYTPEGGAIEFAATLSVSDVIVTVTDTGIGIPSDKLTQVFELFGQINQRLGAGGGLGIGLALVKRLVEMHGGRVEAESAGEGSGATFRVRLPVRVGAADAPSAPSSPAARSPAASKRVLVVDDNADALDSLSRLVKLMGNEVCRARDGLEALELGASFEPDVVLMDLGMPNLDGYEAARRMRQQAWGKSITLVATTGWGQDEDRRRSSGAGFDFHLVKPVSVTSLAGILSPTA
ncbi:hybrid sensor histidine kinase/response regulator [Lacipirellula limnantheis]|uniref:histidine kinase n=1 Tax=Lacipirellula limnantheis TaxID=2528024 RepID=A0A517TY26_9BACT|nr:ATP-binding protein [Lacipirellula limnantheis]QDT73283.1 Autoinducer 2 sensor kinase/phosphatase LuxQ [Lacipirellula limnantheis]